MANNQLCEADKNLENYITNYNINNCPDGYDIFRLVCPGGFSNFFLICQ